MSKATIALHERVAAAVSAREVPAELLATGFRMENRASAVTDHAYHGAEGLREWMNDIFEVFAPGARYAVEEIIADGDDFVVARFCVGGLGARSREALEFRWVGVTWFRDGAAVRAAGYASRREALEAVARGAR